jgi:hypothetical protein
VKLNEKEGSKNNNVAMSCAYLILKYAGVFQGIVEDSALDCGEYNLDLKKKANVRTPICQIRPVPYICSVCGFGEAIR